MEQHNPRSYGVSTALAALRAGLVPILAAGALVAAAALAFTLSLSSDYEAEAIVFPRDPGFANQAFDSQSYITAPATQLAATDLADIDTVARMTAESLGGGYTSNQVSDQVDVTDSETGLILITATAPESAEAAELANAYARAAVASRRDAQAGVVEDAIDTAEQSYEAMAPGSQERTRFARQLDDLRAYRDFQTGNIEQVQEATAPTAPEAKPVLSATIGGGIAGILIGIAGVLILDRARPVLAGRRRAEEIFGAPVLAALPSSPSNDREALETLRARLLYRGEGDVPRTVLLLPLGDEPAGEVASGLGKGLAEGGRNAVVVDARLGEGGGETGLAQVLAGGTPLREAIVAGGPEGPDTLAAGGPVDGGGASLDRPETRTVLTELDAAYDMVVLIGSAIAAGPWSIPLISTVDMTIAVVADRSREEGCLAMAEEIERVGGTLGGVILIER